MFGDEASLWLDGSLHRTWSRVGVQPRVDTFGARKLPQPQAEGQAWLRAYAARIQLHRLPPYPPEFNPIEGAWKATTKRTTHNRFFHTTTERDAALVSIFRAFQAYPTMISGHTQRL